MDHQLDLQLDKETALPPGLVWRALTEPNLLRKWFVPAPWSLAEVELDLYPGGKFSTTMRSPEGELYPDTGSILEVIPERKLVWTSVLEEGFRPKKSPENAPDAFGMTAVIELVPLPDGGTRYTATVLHADEEGRKRHEEMGFESGWSAAFDQLVALMSEEKG
jgi:uncharacterized protein YndB with AHSA1/START domain